jgi:hypothetical protein
MRVVNSEVYKETLKQAIISNFATSSNKFGFCFEKYEYKDTETPLAFYFHFIRVHLGEEEMYKEMNALGIELRKKKQILSLIDNILNDVLNIQKGNYTIHYKRYEEGKMNLVKNYFKHKKISYEKFS